MNKVINWKWILILFVMIAVIQMSFILYQDYNTLPSDNWSKNIILETIEITDNSDQYYEEYFDVIPLENTFIVTRFENSNLIIEKYDSELNLIERTPLDIRLSNIKNVSSEINEGIITVIFTSNDSLYELSYNSINSTLDSMTLISENIETIKAHSPHVIYSIDKDYFFYNANSKDTVFLFNNDSIEQLDFEIKNNIIYMQTINFIEYKYYSVLNTYDIETETTHEYILGKPNLTTGTVSNSADLQLFNDNIYMINTFKNTRYGENYGFIYTVNSDNMEIVQSETIKNLSYDSNFSWIIFDNTINLAFNQSSFIGKIDAGSLRETFPNIFVKTPYAPEAKALTKTEVYAPNYRLFEIDDQQYLLSNEVKNKQNTFYISSDNPNIIQKSTAIKFSDIVNVFFGSMTYLFSALIPMFAPLINILIPVMIIIIPITIVKMRWVEQYPFKILFMFVVTYLISKFYYVFSIRTELIQTESFIGTIPLYLQSLPGLIISVLITSIISLICLHLYKQKKPSQQFMSYFGIYFSTDMVLYLLYFEVYTMMFLH